MNGELAERLGVGRTRSPSPSGTRYSRANWREAVFARKSAQGAREGIDRAGLRCAPTRRSALPRRPNLAISIRRARNPGRARLCRCAKIPLSPDHRIQGRCAPS